ncbi:hypothetical protein [Bacillus nitroreducens]
MGYILPINNEQYTQYVHRTTKYKTNELKLYQVHPATLNMNQRLNPPHVEQKQTSKKQSQYIENVRAQYTGKGLLFDESI